MLLYWKGHSTMGKTDKTSVSSGTMKVFRLDNIQHHLTYMSLLNLGPGDLNHLKYSISTSFS